MGRSRSSISKAEKLSIGEVAQALMEVAREVGSIHDLRTAAKAHNKKSEEKSRLALEPPSQVLFVHPASILY